jgi:hypothetical protein
VTHLLDHGAAIDEAVSAERTTPLQVAAAYRKEDILRMLLRRGASPDEPDADGSDVVFRCIIPVIEEQYRLSASDMLDLSYEWRAYIARRCHDDIARLSMCSTAIRASTYEIGGLLHRDYDFGHCADLGRAALHLAVEFANPATYFALLGQGASIDLAQDLLLYVIDRRAALGKELISHRHADVWRAYDLIVKDLLSRRADLMTSYRVVNRLCVVRQGSAIPLQQSAATYGPEMEVWFLGLLQKCGRLDDEEDKRRLQELRTEGYDQHGIVIGEVEEVSGDERSVVDGSERRAQSSAESEEDDIEEVEFFWDAEEVE